MSELLQDNVEGSDYEREMIDMVYQQASTQWWGDVIALLTASVQILLPWDLE